jgi:hypothetical protein
MADADLNSFFKKKNKKKKSTKIKNPAPDEAASSEVAKAGVAAPPKPVVNADGKTEGGDWAEAEERKAVIRTGGKAVNELG